MATIHPAAIPPAPAVMRVLSRFDRQSLASFITVAIDLLDTLDGDPDAKDMAWPEWNGWPNSGDTSLSEDDEDTHDREEIDERELEDGE